MSLMSKKNLKKALPDNVRRLAIYLKLKKYRNNEYKAAYIID